MPVGSFPYPASSGGSGGGGDSSGDGSASGDGDKPNYPPTTGGDRNLVYLDSTNTTDGGGRTLQIQMNLPPGR